MIYPSVPRSCSGMTLFPSLYFLAFLLHQQQVRSTSSVTLSAADDAAPKQPVRPPLRRQGSGIQ